jgi:threonine/homoserine/homoserine lactone efflux protein
MDTSVQKLAVSALAGLVSGFVVSIPVGPVNLTVINHALRRGFLSALLAGFGAITADTFYATLMIWGHSSLLDQPKLKIAMRVVSVLVIGAVGVRYLLYKADNLEASAAVVERTDERWHHPRSFGLGFILTISNLMLVLLWATLAAALFDHELIAPRWPSRVLYIAGVFLGGASWFFLLAFFVSRAHRRVKPKTLTTLVRSCGVVFLVFAVLLAYRIFTQ